MNQNPEIPCVALLQLNVFEWQMNAGACTYTVCAVWRQDYQISKVCKNHQDEKWEVSQ